METDDPYKSHNCYNRVYKRQIICTKCGLQLRKGVGDPKSFFQAIVLSKFFFFQKNVDDVIPTPASLRTMVFLIIFTIITIIVSTIFAIIL